MNVKALNITFFLTFFFGLLFVNPAIGQEAAEERTARLAEDYNEQVMHHISNANEFHVVGDIHIPLPCILYAPSKGFDVFMSSEFEHGSKAIEGYVLDHGVAMRIIGGEALGAAATLDAVAHHDAHGAEGESHDNHDAKGHDGHNHDGHDHGHDHDGKGSGEQDAHSESHNAHFVYEKTSVNEEGKEEVDRYVSIDHKEYKLQRSSTLLSFTSWFDFSISKNVFSMLLATIVLFLIFRTVAKGYKKRPGQAPKGIQSLMEPIIIFIRDEVAKPAIGEKWQKYFPFILSLFFFVLINNLFGIIPFFPFSANVTGNVGTTLALAFFVFLVTNMSGNKDYWKHVFWMPGIPTFVKPVLAVIEFFGLFIKPFTLFIRLFANITAGHIIILSLVGLIWSFGDYGASVGGSGIGAVLSFMFVSFINILELFVAFLQAFIFALLSALYIGSAVEEHDHHDDHAMAH
jgi:F-type H+-transporting ATPase subunit a